MPRVEERSGEESRSAESIERQAGGDTGCCPARVRVQHGGQVPVDLEERLRIEEEGEAAELLANEA